MRHRGILHQSMLPEFIGWAEREGYKVESARGDDEALRLRRVVLDGTRPPPPICYHRRQGSEHVTASNAGLELVRRWMKARRQSLAARGIIRVGPPYFALRVGTLAEVPPSARGLEVGPPGRTVVLTVEGGDLELHEERTSGCPAVVLRVTEQGAERAKR